MPSPVTLKARLEASRREAEQAYVCLTPTCRYRVSQPLEVCPNCGRRNSFRTASNIRTRQIIGGSVLLSCGVGLLILGVVLLVGQINGTLQMREWWPVLLVFLIGTIMSAGGVSLIFLRSEWFIRFLLFFT